MEVPDHTASFIQLTMILMMIEALSSPVITCLLAVGKVKWYQIIVGGLLILNLPVSYIALHWGCNPEITIQIAIIISFVSLLVRLVMLYRYIKFPVFEFLTKVLMRAMSVVVISFCISMLIYNNTLLHGFSKLLLTGAASWMISAIVILYVGMSKSERNLVYNVIRKFGTKIRIMK